VDLTLYSVVIIIFKMEGCGACEGYMPRLVAHLSRPFYLYEGRKIPPTGIPVLVYDAASEDPKVQQLANRYAIHDMPATLVLRRGQGAFKVEGALDDAQIDYMLQLAREARQ